MTKRFSASEKLARDIETKARQVLHALGRGRISAEEVEDLTQGVVERVFTKAQERGSELQGADLDRYAARAARNAYNDFWRYQKRHGVPRPPPSSESLSSLLLPDSSLTPASKLVRKDEMARRQAAVGEALGALNPGDLRLYEMFYVDGRSHQEIADALGFKSANVVKSKLSRLRKRALNNLPGWLTLPSHLSDGY